MASLDVLLVMALKEESQGLFEAAGISPYYTGVGLVKTTYQLNQWLLEHQPKRVINLGTVGSKTIAKNALVECTSFVQRAPHAFLQIKSKMIHTKALTTLPAVLCGSGDFIEKADPITPCDVFDMEAYAMAFVCAQMNIPFNSIKFVTDHSDENLIHDWKKNLHFSAESLLKCYREITTKISD
ncbi:MAG: hypothetical protein H7328_05890 [Bdellovibrio sp.]|nr:hypothetical protein [Bdellovibrio sp.]